MILGGPESEPFAKQDSAIKETRNFPVFMVPDEEYPLATIIGFEELFAELKAKAAANDPESGTVKELAKGTHFIGKKIIEEAGEIWIASEYETKERTAEEISQLIYHLQVMMIDQEIELEDIYRYL